MATLGLIEYDAASPEVRVVYDDIMAPGALDARTKEMLYLAISSSNQCGYCIASHTAAARKAGMTDAMLSELMAVVGMANESNRLASGYQVEIDEQFKTV